VQVAAAVAEDVSFAIRFRPSAPNYIMPATSA
jgi:hypothetical protein